MKLGLLAVVAVASALDQDFNLGPFHFHVHEGAQTMHDSQKIRSAQPQLSSFRSNLRSRMSNPFHQQQSSLPVIFHGLPQQLQQQDPIAGLKLRVHMPVNMDHMFGDIVDSLFENTELTDLFTPFSEERGFHPSMCTKTVIQHLPNGEVRKTVTEQQNVGGMHMTSTTTTTTPASDPPVPIQQERNPLQALFNSLIMRPGQKMTRITEDFKAPQQPQQPQQPAETATETEPGTEPEAPQATEAAPVVAAGPTVIEVPAGSVCVKDVQSLCKHLVSKKASYLQIFMCLKHQHHQLSAGCQADVEASPAFHCVHDMYQHCKGANNRKAVRKCLDKNKNKLSHTCLSTIMNKASSNVAAIQGQPEVTVGGKVIKLTTTKSHVSANAVAQGKHLDPAVLYGCIGGGVALLLIITVCVCRCRGKKSVGSDKNEPFVQLGKQPVYSKTTVVRTPSSAQKENLSDSDDLYVSPDLASLETVDLGVTDVSVIVGH